MLKRGLVFNLTSDSDTIKDYKSANVLITQSRKHRILGYTDTVGVGYPQQKTQLPQMFPEKSFTRS